MYALVYTTRFKKDVKVIQKRKYNIELLKSVIKELEQDYRKGHIVDNDEVFDKLDKWLVEE